MPGPHARPKPSAKHQKTHRKRPIECVGVFSLVLFLVAGCASGRGEKLIEELSNPMPKKRAEIFEALDKLGPDAGPALHKGLGHMDPLVRRSTRQYILQRRGEKAIPLLLQALKKPSDQLRLNAVQVLGAMAPKRAKEVVPALEKARLDSHGWVRSAAYKALGKYGALKASSLVRALHDPSPAIRLRAATQLAKRAPQGGMAARKALETLSLDRNPRIKQAALQGLKGFGLNTVVGPVAAHLQRKLGLKRYLFHYGKRGAGAPSREQLQGVIKRNWGGVQRCHKRFSQKKSLEGKVVIRWVIYKTGDVLATSIVQSSISSLPFMRCLLLQVGTWRFPRPKGGLVVVSYPFVVSRKP